MNKLITAFTLAIFLSVCTNERYVPFYPDDNKNTNEPSAATPDYDPSATYTPTISDVVVPEQSSIATLTLNISETVASNVIISYSTSDATATAGLDYVLQSGAVAWAYGETGNRTINIPLIDDTLHESDESFSVVIASLQNAVIADNIGIVTLTDNERITYVTTNQYDGALGGSSGADSLCNSDPGRPNTSLTYAALLVDSNRIASQTANVGDGQLNWVLNPTTIYYQPDGTTPIMITNSNSIFLFGTLTNPFNSSSAMVWTGLTINWTSSSKDCANWTSGLNAFKGDAGDATVTDNNAISDSQTNCSSLFRLFCIQQ